MRFFALAILVVATLTSGCATIISGSKQTVRIDSVPTGALVTTHFGDRWTTPCVVEIQRSFPVVTIASEGYAPQTINIYAGMNWWIWGNFAVGPFGILVDVVTGAAYRARDEVVVQLVPVKSELDR